LRADAPATAAGFHTTHWTVVLAAGQSHDTAGREALAVLCSTYWYPIYAYLRRSGSTRHDAEDLTQEFFSGFLKRDSLTNVSPMLGKFRSYLLACLKHFLANERRRAQAQRRGAGVQVIPLDSGAADTRYLAEPSHDITPDVLFERRWAFAVVDLAMKELQREYVQRGKGELFEQLRGFLPGDAPSASRAELAARHEMSPGAVDVAVHRFRQRFGELLREQVARTVSSAAEVEEELRHLISVLST
jgi:RNA polymerase sigma-70 factor (ECF subfamily)